MHLLCLCVFSTVSDPSVFLGPIAEQQYISDILGLIDHGDPQIRGATAILCGAIIQAALTKTRYNIHTWLASVQNATGKCIQKCGEVAFLQVFVLLKC